jgi:hypothetical protein
MRFSLPVRERLLALLAVGCSIEDAAAIAGTSRQTVSRWAARGRAPDAPAEYAAFAERFDSIRSGEAEDVARRREAEEEPAAPVFGDSDYRDEFTDLEWDPVSGADLCGAGRPDPRSAEERAAAIERHVADRPEAS